MLLTLLRCATLLYSVGGLSWSCLYTVPLCRIHLDSTTFFRSQEVNLRLRASRSHMRGAGLSGLGFFSTTGLGMAMFTVGRICPFRRGLLLFSKLPSLLEALDECERETLLLRRRRLLSTLRMPLLWLFWDCWRAPTWDLNSSVLLWLKP